LKTERTNTTKGDKSQVMIPAQRSIMEVKACEDHEYHGIDHLDGGAMRRKREQIGL